MRKYVIEREIPGIGASSPAQLCEGARTSNRALSEVGAGIQWIHSYVTADKTFCIYLADDEALIREHAERSGFPANRITAIDSISWLLDKK